MKYGLMVVGTETGINIGDYIQAIAAKQFLPQVDKYIERERLKEYSEDNIAMIMNGYYMHNGNQWPPSSSIIPLYVAFHINDLVKDAFSSSESINYLKQYEPIGCRDKTTEFFLREKGIKAYFSGCLTLTLGKTYKYKGERKGIYFVDPPITFLNRKEKIKYLIKSIFKWTKIKNIYKKKHNRNINIKNWCETSKFYFTYTQFFEENILLNANYITQQSKLYKEKYNSNEELLDIAEKLINTYAKAELVITSRIHCALPCLGLDTKVLYIYNDLQTKASSCRMDGLKQLFNIVHWDGYKLYSDIKPNNEKIKVTNCPPNKKDWEKYAKELSQRCDEFIHHNNSLLSTKNRK
jgi:hypothetical protein